MIISVIDSLCLQGLQIFLEIIDVLESVEWQLERNKLG